MAYLSYRPDVEQLEPEEQETIDGIIRSVIRSPTLTSARRPYASATMSRSSARWAVLPERVERMAETLLKKAEAADLTLATAESCTGGLLASLLTDVEGRSHMFDRGFVVYSEHAKCQLLGLAQEQIDSCGAVSREVAVAMADGALKGSNAQVALAITGFAGPGGPDDEPGLVHFACAREGSRTTHREEHFGDIGRGGVRRACLEVALEMMIDAVE